MSEETKTEIREHRTRYSDSPITFRIKDNAVLLLVVALFSGGSGTMLSGMAGKVIGNGNNNASLEKLERHFIPRVELMEKNFQMMQLLTTMDNRLKNIEEGIKKGNP